MKRSILLSLALVVAIGAGIAGATGAFFSDTETSTGNTFTAGAIDLKIDSVSHYNGMVCTLVGETYHWIPELNVTLNGENQPVAGEAMNSQAEWDAYNLENPEQYPAAGDPCVGTWPLKDLNDENDNEVGLTAFFDFDDIKPGDNGENTISIHIDSNDAWMCASVAGIEDADNTQTEPESEDPDDTDDLASGELAENLHFFAWVDDGDNIYEPGEQIGTTTEEEVALGGPVSASELATTTWALADSTTGDGPINGGTTQYIGVLWCAGEIEVDGSTVTCDGSAMGNEAQTDSWAADLSFYVEQSRNNPDFECNPEGDPETATVTLDKVVTFTSTTVVGVDVNDFTLHLVGPGGDHVLVDQVAFPGLTPGAYVVSEVYSNSPAGIEFNASFSGSCTEIGDSGTANFNVVAGVNPTCTITNLVESEVPA